MQTTGLSLVRRSMSTLAVVLLCLTDDVPAQACGGGGVTSESGVVVDAQRIVVSSRENGTTDVIVHVSVPRASSNFGLLIPVPSEPTLHAKPIPSHELEQLDQTTAPQIFIREPETDEPLIGCGSTKLGGGVAPSRATAGRFVEIGPVVAVSLSGDDASDIHTWLQDNGFSLPTSDSEVLERYVHAGSYFIAVKRSDTATDGSPQSIGLHYTLSGDHRMVSLAFARIGADEHVGFTVFLANKATLGPSAPFKALTLDDLDVDALKDDYDLAIRKAVSANDSKAFVIENSTEASSLATELPELSELFDSDAMITRATTVVARDELTADAMFATAFKEDIPDSRTLSFSASKLGSSRTPLFGMALFGALLSLKIRRRNT